LRYDDDPVVMITTLLLLALILLLAYIGSHRRLSRSQFAVVSLFFTFGSTLVVTPGLANRIAHFLNVGRGADLLLYFAVLGAVYAAAHFYFRFKQIEQALVSIVRDLALLKPTKPDAGGVRDLEADPER